jgi:DNA repair protein RecN (Recombination protein N)
VGRKLHDLARHHQVLVITHLPQLAAYGDAHYRVAKAVRDGRTTTTVTPLAGEARVRELAQMLGGLNDEMLRSARTLLEN